MSSPSEPDVRTGDQDVSAVDVHARKKVYFHVDAYVTQPGHTFDRVEGAIDAAVKDAVAQVLQREQERERQLRQDRLQAIYGGLIDKNAELMRRLAN